MAFLDMPSIGIRNDFIHSFEV